MKTHIQKWGNSLGVRIPIRLSHQLKLKPGSFVNVTLENDHLVILPQRYHLEEMLTNITNENCHHTVLEGVSRGYEEW